MGLWDCSEINTEPGVSSIDPFCPPADFEGGPREYLKLIGHRMKEFGIGTQMIFAANYRHREKWSVAKPQEVKGRFANEASKALNFLAKPKV
jgi:hypothetical protein